MLLNKPSNLNTTNTTKEKQIKEDFNLNCILTDSNNIAKNYDSDFFEKKSLIEEHIKNLNSHKVSKNIYTSKSLIPFNFRDKLDNNIIYNLNTKKRDSILKNEKKYYNKIQPYNQRVLTAQYNKSADNFLNDHETPQKYKQDCKDYQLFDNEMIKITLK